MKKTIMIFTLAALMVAFAQNIADEGLQSRHIDLLKQAGEENLAQGIHYFAVFDNVPASVYFAGDRKSIYLECGEKCHHCVVTLSGDTLFFNETITESGETLKVKYDMTFRWENDSRGYFATVDRDHSAIGDEQWGEIFSLILDSAACLYREISEAGHLSADTLHLVGPALFNAPIVPCTAVAEGERAILTQTIFFSWSWGYSTGFKAPPVYKEMPNQIIGFDTVKISNAKNAWNIQIAGDTAGNNVARVLLARVTFMCYPKFWSSSVSGTVRCVMQK